MTGEKGSMGGAGGHLGRGYELERQLGAYEGQEGSLVTLRDFKRL